VYVYVSCAWIMWLLVKYYSAYVILRQRFLTSGEASINEWHEQYMQGSLDKTGKEEGKGVLAALKHFKQLFDPSEVCRSLYFPNMTLSLVPQYTHVACRQPETIMLSQASISAFLFEKCSQMLL